MLDDRARLCVCKHRQVGPGACQHWSLWGLLFVLDSWTGPRPVQPISRWFVWSRFYIIEPLPCVTVAPLVASLVAGAVHGATLRLLSSVISGIVVSFIFAFLQYWQTCALMNKANISNDSYTETYAEIWASLVLST